jgi:NADPH2:quinone reductase
MKAVGYERAGAAPDVLTFGDMPTPLAGPAAVAGTSSHYF